MQYNTVLLVQYLEVCSPSRSEVDAGDKAQARLRHLQGFAQEEVKHMSTVLCLQHQQQQA